jgi:hypothetical protein
VKQSTSFAEDPQDQPGPEVSEQERLQVEVPDLIGREPNVALDRVRALGLVPAVESGAVTDEDYVGVVYAQEPAGGTVLEVGAVISIVIGQQPVRDESAQPVEEPLEEDDWFDIELPVLDGGPHEEASHVDTALAPAHNPHEGNSSDGGHIRSAGDAGRGRLSSGRHRVALVSVGVVAALALLAVRSCGEPRSAQRADQASTPRSLSTPSSARRASARPMPRPVHGQHLERPARPSRRPGASAQPPVVVSPPLTAPHATAPALSVPDACEFCLERPSP